MEVLPSYLNLMKKIRLICSLLIGLTLITLVPGKSLSDNFSEYLLDEKYPFIKMQRARFIACAEGGVSFFETYGGFIAVSNALNETCFENISRQMAQHNKDKLKSRFELSTYPEYYYELDFTSKESKYNNQLFTIANVASPFHLNCMQNCTYTKEDLIRLGDRYYVNRKFF